MVIFPVFSCKLLAKTRKNWIKIVFCIQNTVYSIPIGARPHFRENLGAYDELPCTFEHMLGYIDRVISDRVARDRSADITGKLQDCYKTMKLKIGF